MLPDDLRDYEAPTFIGMIPREVAGYILVWGVAILMLLDVIGVFR